MFDGIKKSISECVSPTKAHLGELRQDFRSRLTQFRQERSTDRQQRLEKDFNRVLQAWGIDGVEAIPGVVRVLWLRCLIFTAPMLACTITATLLHNPASCLALACVAPPCLFGIVTTAWRISILKNRRFLPLSRWIASGFGLAQKRP